MDSLHSPAESGPYDTFISNKMPAWVKHTVADDIKRLKPGLFPGYTAPADADNRFARAPSWQIQALLASQLRSRAANQALALALGHLQGITQFAEPRLQEALQSHQGQGRAMDINSDRLFYLRRNRPVQQQTLLQAALSNFEGNEDFNQRVAGQVSALAPPGALPVERFVPQTGPDYPAMLADSLVHGSGWPVDKVKQELDNLNPVAGFSYQQTLPMNPQVFSQICRALDLGAQYQAHLNEVFAPPAVRSLMIRAQIELLAVRLHTALIQGHVSLAAHAMVMALLQRQRDPQLYGKPVVFNRLQIYGMTLDEVLVIGPYRSRWPVLEWEHSGVDGVPVMKKPDMEPLVVYIPGALMTPLKEYPSFEAFQYELGLNLRDPACRQLIASLVPQGSAGAFMARLNQHLYQTRPDQTLLARCRRCMWTKWISSWRWSALIRQPMSCSRPSTTSTWTGSRPMPACWRCPRPMPTASCCRNAWSTT
ncbi:dermonecrotic toxin domain-containing protein [Pseudomonas fragi]|uniref:dermonecrotic toxin domain-containing protein n=1 Tax=Pseudomonas fragi TaxID=296 RepID=UPI002F2B1D16